MTWFADLRYVLRRLRRNPLFTGAAVASLALGLGANAAIFNLLDQVLFRSLPVKDAGQLVLLDSPGPASGMFSGDKISRLFSYPMYQSLRDRGAGFDGLIARFPVGLNLSFGGPAEAVSGELVSGNYFDVLGIRPAVGRLLGPSDDVVKGAHAVAVLSYGLWMRQFGGDAGVVGKTVRVNSTPMTVVGVARQGFFGVYIGRATDLYVPISMKAQMTPTWDRLEDRRAHWLHILGRVQDRAAAEASMQVVYKPELEADLAVLGPRITPDFRQHFLEKKLFLEPAAGGIPTFREQGLGLWFLMAMAGLVLLIACFNVANLMMARVLARRKEVAVRLAVGARRWDLVRQVLTESMVLALLGGMAGMALASGTYALVVHNVPGDEGVSALAPDLDWRAVGFVLALTVVSGLLFGLLPALQGTRSKLYAALAAQGTQFTGGRGHIRARRAFVVAQMALSLLLVAGAGLFTRSLINLRQLDPGFREQNLVLFTIDASRNGYSQERIRQVYDTVRERMAAVPGVSLAALGDTMPLNGDHNESGVRVDGVAKQDVQDKSVSAYHESVSPGFFATSGIPVVGGRDFDARDQADAPRVAVVNEAFVRQFFPSGGALGRKFAFGQDLPSMEIVGVVKDAKYADLHEENVRQVYMPFPQAEALADMTVHIRTAAPPAVVMPALRAAMAQIDPELAMRDLTTMEDQLNRSLFGERLLAFLCASFAALATLLATVGLYGVTAFSVARRGREIGIRMALGAGRERILSMVLKEVGWMCLIGVGLGLPAAVGLAVVMQSELYGVKTADPVTLAASVCLLLTVSLLAGNIPARRAASIQPNEMLRYE